MQKTRDQENQKKLTLDKILGPENTEDGGKERIYAYPERCKNCQHCGNIPIRPSDPSNSAH